MKKLVFIVLLLVGCSANYVIPDGKAQYDFDRAKEECQAITGAKLGGFALGHPVFVLAVMGGGAVYNGVVEYRFRNCMHERGFEVEQ